jgi:hypothetical protein
MTAWNDFIKEHRNKDEYKDTPYRELLKILSPLYKQQKNFISNETRNSDKVFKKTKLNYKGII